MFLGKQTTYTLQFLETLIATLKIGNYRRKTSKILIVIKLVTPLASLQCFVDLYNRLYLFQVHTRILFFRLI